MSQNPYVSWYQDLGVNHIESVGGKNASLGEMIANLTAAGIKVPQGFATTAYAFNEFIRDNQLEEKIAKALAELDSENVNALAATGKAIRDAIINAELQAPFKDAITLAYQQLVKESGEKASFAVRSSATAEDLPDASFAGQQETILNVKGLENILKAVKTVFASLYNDRAIAYRVHQGYAHLNVALSVGIQRMVRSDKAASGVMFTLDTESGFPDVVFITSSYGLGETIVQGAVNPDEFYVHKATLKAGRDPIIGRHLGTKASKMIYQQEGAGVKTVAVETQNKLRFSLTDQEIKTLANTALLIEDHYGRPMDIEWAKDGDEGELYIVQARPETVKSRQNQQVIERYHLNETGEVLITGRSIGQRIGKGIVRVIQSTSEMSRVQPGDVLVADMTDPDWEPIMKKASAIVTNRGGRTCHAAIIARELGIPAVVGCGEATKVIKEGEKVTVSCAEGETGKVYKGLLDYEIKRMDLKTMPQAKVKIMLNVGNPDRAFAFHSIPNSGVGLARLEFIISNMIGVHPQALLNFDKLPLDLQTKILQKTTAYASPIEFYIEKLKEGIATIASAFYPEKVIVRLSDFKSNEYANLLGGDIYEPKEENPMLGFRGASRYLAKEFRDCFALECEAVKRVRNLQGFNNVEIMIPFVRTVAEAKGVIETLADFGLRRGENGLRIIMMCELPSNALLADEFLEYFDGFSIGSNDLTQLTLGLDRDSALIAASFDERNAAVKALLTLAIKACRAKNKYVGICGQGPSDHPDFADWLVEQGIESLSLNPDSVLETCFYLANKRD